MERSLCEEINRLISLRDRINSCINAVKVYDAQLVLRYRYLEHLTWEQIGDRLFIDESTARRRHKKALDGLVIPEK